LHFLGRYSTTWATSTPRRNIFEWVNTFI
jgi:hypothetical protein